MNIEWWHWAVGGIVLVLLELAIPAFFVIWFGFGAFLVAASLFLMPGLSLPVQLAVWTGASILMTVLWFKVFRSSTHRTLSGTAAGDVLGEVGLLVTAVAPYQRGRVRFQRPLLGADEWVCMAETSMAVGDRVRVIAIEGSFLKVARA